jgi:hypothetical protein
LSLFSLLKTDTVFSENENRVLAQKPAISLKTVLDGSFEADFEEYISDQFCFRDAWIRLKTLSEIALLKKDINGVYIGRDDYLIEMHEDIDTTAAYQNADYVLEFIKDSIQSLGSENVHMMLVPTASAVLTDYLVSHTVDFDQDSLIDYVKYSIADNFIDVRDELKAHQGDYVYYRTDHHWTSYGAYLSYVKWAKECGFEPYAEEDFDIEVFSEEFLGSTFSKINYAKRKDTIELYKLKENITYSVNINNGQKLGDSMFIREYLDEKDKYQVFLGGNNPIVTINTDKNNNDGDERVLLVIKDSYAHCFVPFAANHYDKTVMVDLRYLKQTVSQVIEDNKVTDILVLYNAAQFAEDTNLQFISR